MGEGWALCVYVKERERGRGLSVRVDLAGGVYRGGYMCEGKKGEQLSVLVECVLKGHSVKNLGGLNHPPPPRLKPPPAVIDSID